MRLFVNFCHVGGGSPIPKCKCQTKNYHLCENQKCTLQGLICKINFEFFEQAVLKRKHGQSAIREKFPNNPIIDFSASLSLCYGASLCYGINLCYGVNRQPELWCQPVPPHQPLLAPPCGALLESSQIVKWFKDPVQSHPIQSSPTFRFECSKLLQTLQ